MEQHAALDMPPNAAGIGFLEQLRDPGFSPFYGAGTLIVIYGRSKGPLVTADCWLAAENLMLAACALGLGTCVIGAAVDAFNSADAGRISSAGRGACRGADRCGRARRARGRSAPAARP